MAPVGVVFDVMLLKVLFVIVFVGPLAADVPSMLFHPSITVLPLTVTLEKLFRLFVIVAKFTEAPLAVSKKVTVPPAVPLLKAVTMELLFTFSVPVAVRPPDRVKNVTLPLVLTFRFVNVLVFTFVVVELALFHVM